ncbi:MAG: helix-turn-helix domain-containing protein [Thermoguttaceae bacterium]
MTRTSTKGTRKPFTVAKAEAPVETEILNQAQAAKLLGVCQRGVMAAVRNGSLPHRRIARRLLFSRKALLAWVASGGVTETTDN